MIFDTDVLIWVARGNVKASKAIENCPKRQISTQTYLELLQCATDKRQQALARTFLSPPAISHRNTRCVDRAGKYFLECAA